MGIGVRLATIEDVSWIVSELKTFSETLPTKGKLFGGEEIIRERLIPLLGHQPIFVAYKDDTLIGMVGGWASSHPLNPKLRVLCEAFWWVSEKYRGTRAGYLLLKTFVEWGKQNVHWISFSIESESPVNDSTFLKLGFKPAERKFLLEVKDV